MSHFSMWIWGKKGINKKSKKVAKSFKNCPGEVLRDSETANSLDTFDIDCYSFTHHYTDSFDLTNRIKTG